MSNRLGIPAGRVATLTAYQIFTGPTYRGTVFAADRIEARDQGRQQFGLPAGWTVDAYAPGESPHDDPMDALGGLDEHIGRRRMRW